MAVLKLAIVPRFKEQGQEGKSAEGLSKSLLQQEVTQTLT